MDSHISEAIEKCLKSCQLILENRQKIVAQGELYYANPSNISAEVQLKDNVTLDLSRRLCSNAELFTLFLIKIDVDPLLMYLGKKFLIKYRKLDSDDNWDYPCDIEVWSNKHWLQPLRWQYVQFVIDELRYVLENGTRKGKDLIAESYQ